MHIIIDGYNILKLVYDTTHITDHQRQSFIFSLNHYATIKDHDITLVFDGGPYDRTTKIPQKSIDVLYAGPHISADEVIINLLDRSQPSTTLIVTSDRVINQEASDRGFISLDSEEFYTILRQSLRQKKVTSSHQEHKAHKHADHQSSAQLDALMEMASQVVLTKPEDIPSLPDHEQKLSKKEKKMHDLLKKL